MVDIIEVNTPKLVKVFVKFPFKIYKNNKYWVPYIIDDEVKAITPGKNPAFEFCDCKFWLAMRNGEVVGRIGGIINRLVNEKFGENMARFTRSEFIDDKEVFDALINTAEKWAKECGCDGIHGPLGFSNLDHQAVLVEGFDYIASAASEYHPEYYHKHIERVGYLKEVDWLEFRLKIPVELPTKAARVGEMVKKRYGMRVVEFDKKEELRPYARQLFDIFNQAFDSLFGTFEFNKKMIDYHIEKYFSILNIKFVKLILDSEDNFVGFIVGVPSLSKALQKTKGKLFPFGFIHLKKALSHPDEIDLFLTGSLPAYANHGVGSIMTIELYKACIDNGIKMVETTGMLETNHVAIQHWKMYDHIQHKRKRCYKKMFV